MRIRPLFNEADVWILQSLFKDDKTTFSRLCKHPKANAVTMGRAIKKLEDRGIIKKKVNPESKREILLSYCYPKLKIDELITLLEG